MKMRSISMAVATLCAVSACTKDVSDDHSIQSEPATRNAQAWFEKQSQALPTSLKATTATLSFKGETRLWEKARFFPESRTSLIPVKLAAPSTAATKITKFLLVQENASGSVEGGYYCYILTRGTLPDITPAFCTGAVPEGFMGAIVRYNLDGSLIGSSHYANGEPTGAQDKIAPKQRSYDPKDDPGNQNIVPLDEGCSYVTIDWYWQTYVNGVLVEEVFLFSSTEVVCEGGGGGPSQGATCAQQAAEFLNAGHPVSVLQSMETDMDADSLRCTIRPNWKIYSAVTWFIYSYETIVWARTSRNQAFVFSSYATRGDAALGTTVGGTRSYTIISKTPIPVGPAGTTVIVEIDFTVKNQAVCNSMPIEPVVFGARSSMPFRPPVTVIYEN